MRKLVHNSMPPREISSNAAPIDPTSFSLGRQARATALYTFFGFLPLLSSFFLLPVNTTYLSPAEFGLVALAGITRTYLYLFVSFGLDHAAARFYFDYNQSTERIRFFLSSVITAMLLVTSLVIGLLLLFGEQLFSLVWQGDLSFAEYGWYVTLTSIGDSFNAVLLQFYRVSRSLRRYAWLSFLAFSLPTLGSLTGMVVFQMGALGNIAGKCYGLMIVSIPFLIATLVRTGIRFDVGVLKIFFSYSSPLVVYSVFGNTTAMVDKIILNAKFGLAELGVYNLAFVGASVIGVLLYGFWNAATPEIYRIYEAQRDRGFEKVRDYCTATFLLAFVAVCGLIAVAEPVLVLFADATFHEAARYIPVLASAFLFRALYVIYTLNIFYHKETKVLPTITVVTLAWTTVVMLLLAESFGIIGVAISVVLVQFGFFISAYALDVRRHRRHRTFLFPVGRVVPLIAATLTVILLNHLFLYHYVYKTAVLHIVESLLLLTFTAAVWRNHLKSFLGYFRRLRAETSTSL